MNSMIHIALITTGTGTGTVLQRTVPYLRVGEDQILFLTGERGVERNQKEIVLFP